jgi:hypothetical protein
VTSNIQSLDAIIATQKVHLDRESETLELDLVSSERAFWEYFKVLSKSLDILGDLLQNHKLKRQFQADEVNSKWLDSQFKTLMLKLQ